MVHIIGHIIWSIEYGQYDMVCMPIKYGLNDIVK